MQEPLCGDELEINNLSNSLKVVEVNLVVWLDAENACQMLVVEVDVEESALLNISDLFSDDNLLEINKWMFNLNIFVDENLAFCLRFFSNFVSEVFDSPSHVRIFVNHLLNNFLLSVMEIMEILFDMESFLLSSERR